MSVEEIGPMTPVSPSTSAERDAVEADRIAEETRIRQEEELEALRREEEFRREHQIDEFA